MYGDDDHGGDDEGEVDRVVVGQGWVLRGQARGHAEGHGAEEL